MAKVCVICNKNKATGHKVSHSNIKTIRRWRPNIQKIKIMLDGSPKRANVCTRCIKAGKIEYRLDKTNIIHCPIGKVSFGQEKLEDNFNSIMKAIIKAKPSAAKGQYLKSVTITSTMGVGIKVNASKVAAQ